MIEEELIRIVSQGGSGAFVGYLMYLLAKRELKEVKISLGRIERNLIKMGENAKTKDK